MPTYEYKCPGCGWRFTERRPADDPEKDGAKCPTCLGPARRVFSTPHLAKFIAADPNDKEQWR